MMLWFDIDDDRIQVQFRMIPVQPVRIFEEEVPAVYPGHFVRLRGGDQLPALIQFDDPVDPGKDHFRHIKRLDDKVRRAQLERLQFRGLLRRQHDDRDLSQRLILPDDLQDLQAVHYRHHQVEEHQRQVCRMCPHHIEGFLPVPGGQDPVIILQDGFQRIPVDLLIVHHQYLHRPLDLL